MITCRYGLPHLRRGIPRRYGGRERGRLRQRLAQSGVEVEWSAQVTGVVNTGLDDAENLAWRLAPVPGVARRGRRPPTSTVPSVDKASSKDYDETIVEEIAPLEGRDRPEVTKRPAVGSRPRRRA